jgi:hypothetical protein
MRMRVQIDAKKAGILLAMSALLCGSAGADTLEFRNGAILEGSYAGGTSTTIQFSTSGGVQAYLTSDIASMHLELPPPPAPLPPPPVAPPAPAPAPAAPGQMQVVPAGTIITMQMDMQITSKNKPGTKFTGKLMLDLLAGEVTIAPAGTTVFGEVGDSNQAGNLVGKSQLLITLTGLSMGGRLLPIATTNFAETGNSSFAKTARNAGVGALVGAAFGGGKGAGQGAAIGAGVSVLTKGDSVTVPAGAILDFRLSQPLILQP